MARPRASTTLPTTAPRGRTKPSAGELRAARRVARVGRAWQLGLESVEGVMRAEVVDQHTPGLRMADGEAIVRVWGGEPGEVRRVIEVARVRLMPEVAVCVEWRPVTAWVRVREAVAWRWTLVRLWWARRKARRW